MTYPTTPRATWWTTTTARRSPTRIAGWKISTRQATADWVAAQNAVTEPYLASLPLRQHFTDRLTALWNYPRVSLPMTEGGQLFYAKNTGLQRQAPIFMRASPAAAPRLVLDPNTISEDGSISLAQYAPSPDAKLLAYALAKGGADWQTIKVRDIAHRAGPRRRSALDALLESVVDEGRARASSTRAIPSRRRTRCSKPRSPGRRSTTTASARRSRPTSSSTSARTWPGGSINGIGDRRRPLPADHDGRRLRQPEPAATTPTSATPTRHDISARGAAGDRDRRCGVRADRERGAGALPAVGQGRARIAR